MPELPEVETVCRGLEKHMKGKRIAAFRTLRGGLRRPFPPTLLDIRNVTCKSVTRRAKYILINLSGGHTLIIHLGMSGRMLIGANPKPAKHDHFIIELAGKDAVTLNDPRRFGVVDITPTAVLATHKLFAAVGPEPLEKEFNPAYLAQRLSASRVAIKVAIMDQRVVVGVGNIYASEALFMAGINPKRAAHSLTAAEFKKLVPAIRAVLQKAIRAGGSSLRDYVQTDGELGYFQHHFSVYGRAGEICKKCRKTAIEAITQGGRTTFYCPRCQK